jgi:hypothetical protein
MPMMNQTCKISLAESRLPPRSRSQMISFRYSKCKKAAPSSLASGLLRWPVRSPIYMQREPWLSRVERLDATSLCGKSLPRPGLPLFCVCVCIDAFMYTILKCMSAQMPVCIYECIPYGTSSNFLLPEWSSAGSPATARSFSGSPQWVGSVDSLYRISLMWPVYEKSPSILVQNSNPGHLLRLAK